VSFTFPDLGFSDRTRYEESASVIRIPGAFDDQRDAGEVMSEPGITGDAETRRWLARELHDAVSNPLSEMLLEMEYLKRAGGESILREEIAVLQTSTRDVLQRLRRLLSGLRDEPSDLTGFADLVQQTLERFERQSGIQTFLVCCDGWPGHLDGRIAHHLLRIIEEALQNVRRHSCARSVEISLDYRDDDAMLTVQDDGSGLRGVLDGQAYGIRGMHEYAVLAGGDLSIESFPDQGTTVRVLLPLGRDR
jgi:signal transduction histidine kinase